VSGPAVDVLLALGVLAQLIASFGLLVARTPEDRLHYTSAGFTVGPFCVLAALLVRRHLTPPGLDSIATVGLLFLAGPIVIHATARALRRSRHGHLRPLPEERVR
jgi:multisubunit Na+/H+ antiporter MnhG subunit